MHIILHETEGRVITIILFVVSGNYLFWCLLSCFCQRRHYWACADSKITHSAVRTKDSTYAAFACSQADGQHRLDDTGKTNKQTVWQNRHDNMRHRRHSRNTDNKEGSVKKLFIKSKYVFLLCCCLVVTFLCCCLSQVSLVKENADLRSQLHFVHLESLYAEMANK